jgi:hypothetical protein
VSKWADYVITAVGYNVNNTHIVEVEIRPDTGTTIGQPSRESRARVVQAIMGGTTFVTAFMRDGKWNKGEDVRAVRIGNDVFLRTDSNAVRADNLGELPRLPASPASAWTGR